MLCTNAICLKINMAKVTTESYVSKGNKQKVTKPKQDRYKTRKI